MTLEERYYRHGRGLVPRGDWQGLVGQQIEAVVTTGVMLADHLMVQVHLVFDDGSTFEIYSPSGDLCGGSRLYRGDLFEVLSYVHPGTEARVYGATEAPEPVPESDQGD